MITFENGARLCERFEEFPLEKFVNRRDIYLDFEASSGDPSIAALNPHRVEECRALSFGVTADNDPGTYVLDIRTVGRDNFIRAARAILTTCKRWINHNVGFDAHIAYNDLGIPTPRILVDTLDLAKIVDSDRQFKGGYGLDWLSYWWIKEDIKKYELRVKTALGKSKNYADCPTDILAEYNGQDVISNRRIWRYIQAHTPADCLEVQAEELALCYNVVMIERRGMRVSPKQLRAQEFINLNRLSDYEDKLEVLTGRRFRPHVTDDVYDVLCGQYGLPVVKHTDNWNEFEDEEDEYVSFDKYALAEYQSMPFAPQDVIQLIVDFRKLNTQNTLFVKPLQLKHVNGRIHPYYNKTVRTGRMSCRDPNAQQMDKLAKKLILASEGCSLLSIDWSQIEFRTIVHYINDAAAIAAYIADPDTDFHQFTAEMCELLCPVYNDPVAHAKTFDADGVCKTCKNGRKSAKTINFLMGYGGGRDRLLMALMKEPAIVNAVMKDVERLIREGKIKDDERKEAFDAIARKRAEGIYWKYHAKLPTLKTMSKVAECAARKNGYIKNLAGRRRHLTDRQHIAFNTANQSSAADMMKYTANDVAAALEGTEIGLIGLIHDEFLFEGPTELINDPRTVRDIIDILEHPRIKLRVPVRCSYGLSDKDWYSAGLAEAKLHYKREDCGQLQHLERRAG